MVVKCVPEPQQQGKRPDRREEDVRGRSGQRKLSVVGWHGESPFCIWYYILIHAVWSVNRWLPVWTCACRNSPSRNPEIQRFGDVF